MKNTAHKPAFYLAALCSALPLLMGASGPIREDVVKVDPVPFIPNFTSERRDLANEPRTHDNTGTIVEWLEAAPAPALQNESALCHLLVTVPSGPVFCYWVQF